ncbi:MAG: T9SS type A sorting domain-containing protein [Bacteroidales bacterium]|nr:T9SS type A sorting domain-containing protein [Bacteroidales bacterium]
MYWLRIDRDNGNLLSYGKARSETATTLNIYTGGLPIDPRMGIANGKVVATFNYGHSFSFADTTVDRGSSSSWATALGIWDEDGNELACYDFNAEHNYNRNRGVYLKDSALYITGVLFSSGTFGDTTLPNAGCRAYIAKYVDPSLMQPSGTREQQHIVWNQTLDFSAQPSPIALNATATSGLPVHYASSNPGVAYIDGENLFFAGEGDATVTATQPGNYLFFAAQPVTKPVITPSGHNPGTEGIEEAASSQQSAVSVYPNPTSGVANISSQAAIKELTVTDMAGRVLLHRSSLGTSTTLDTSPLRPGLYLLKVTTASGTSTSKLEVR